MMRSISIGVPYGSGSLKWGLVIIKSDHIDCVFHCDLSPSRWSQKGDAAETDPMLLCH